jgi:hypothetical protein
MPNYYTVTRNPIARAGVIRALMRKGYVLFDGKTVSDYFRMWPAETWPVVFTRNDEAGRPPYIDLLRDLQGYKQGFPSNMVRFSPNKAHTVPNIAPMIVTASVVLPAPAKYDVTYVTADGRTGNYTVSNPIEANKDSITVYTFGRGVRTFKKNQIRRFAKVA